jgi:hypothetical protein
MQYYMLEINGLIKPNWHSHFIICSLCSISICIVTSVMLSHNFNERQSRLIDALIVAWLFYVCFWNNMYNHVTRYGPLTLNWFIACF